MNDLILINDQLIKEITHYKFPFYLLKNKVIYNKKIFLNFIEFYQIKYIKLKNKDFCYLISDTDVYQYAYGPEIIKKIFNNHKGK